MPFYNAHRYQTILPYRHSHNSEESDVEREIAKNLNERGFQTRFIMSAVCIGIMNLLHLMRLSAEANKADYFFENHIMRNAYFYSINAKYKKYFYKLAYIIDFFV